MRLERLAYVFITDGDHESNAGGDGWLGDWISLIAATPEHQSGDTAIVVLWDEGGGSDSNHGESCADAAHADIHAYPSCWVAALVISPATRPGTRSLTYFNHYSLLRTTEDRSASTAISPTPRMSAPRVCAAPSTCEERGSRAFAWAQKCPDSALLSIIVDLETGLIEKLE